MMSKDVQQLSQALFNYDLPKIEQAANAYGGLTEGEGTEGGHYGDGELRENGMVLKDCEITDAGGEELSRFNSGSHQLLVAPGNGRDRVFSSLFSEDGGGGSRISNSGPLEFPSRMTSTGLSSINPFNDELTRNEMVDRFFGTEPPNSESFSPNWTESDQRQSALGRLQAKDMSIDSPRELSAGASLIPPDPSPISQNLAKIKSGRKSSKKKLNPQNSSSNVLELHKPEEAPMKASSKPTPSKPRGRPKGKAKDKEEKQATPPGKESSTYSFQTHQKALLRRLIKSLSNAFSDYHDRQQFYDLKNRVQQKRLITDFYLDHLKVPPTTFKKYKFFLVFAVFRNLTEALSLPKTPFSALITRMFPRQKNEKLGTCKVNKANWQAFFSNNIVKALFTTIAPPGGSPIFREELQSYIEEEIAQKQGADCVQKFMKSSSKMGIDLTDYTP